MNILEKLKILAADVQENPFKVGGILVCEWGYSARFVDFYEVSKVSPSSISVKHLQDKNTSLDEYGQAGKKVPLKGKYEKDPDVDGKTFRVTPAGKYAAYNFPFIKIKGKGLVEPWDGKPKSWDSYD